MTRALVYASCIIVLAGCDGGDACTPGRAGCPCSAGNVCESTPDAPLTCDHGWCIPRDCLRGSEGCGCYANGTCDPLDGVPMTCEGGVCRVTVVPEPGTLNGRCESQNRCGDQDGTPLVCVNGRCELADCPSGALGCPCASYGACDPYGSRQPVCYAGTCQLGDCTDGADGCACRSDGGCDAGSCQRGLCLPEPGVAIEVTGDARACELLVGVGDAEAVEVEYGEGVLGRDRRRGDRVAIALTERRDVPLTAPARVVVTPRRRATGRPSTAAPTLISADCFDRLGHRADGALVRLGGSP